MTAPTTPEELAAAAAAAQQQTIEYLLKPGAAPGPDGRIWGFLDIQTGGSIYRMIIPPEVIPAMTQGFAEKFAEMSRMVRRQNSGLIIPPGVRRE